MSEIGVEVWSGSVNTWQCDAMGHMNVRFYVASAMEALAGFAAELGMPRAFSPSAEASLIVRDQHIRFLREARPGAMVRITASVASMDETDARIVLLMHHFNGDLAASFQTVVSHVTAREGRPFPWSARVRERARALTGPIPARAEARSLQLDPVTTTASLKKAEDFGLARISAGTVLSQDCDVFGRMRTELFIGRISDGAPRLSHNSSAGPGEPTVGPDGQPLGGAVLEYRLLYLAWPRAGDRLEVRSGVAGAEEFTRRVVHWLLDPESGEPWCVAEAIAGSLDLKARKLAPLPPKVLQAIRERVIPGLAL